MNFIFYFQLIVTSLWNVHDRSQPWIHMQRSNFKDVHALHPVKLSPLLDGSQSHNDFFCKIIMPWIEDPKGVVPKFTPKPYNTNQTFMYKFVHNLNERAELITSN